MESLISLFPTYALKRKQYDTKGVGRETTKLNEGEKELPPPLFIFLETNNTPSMWHFVGTHFGLHDPTVSSQGERGAKLNVETS